MAGVDTASVDDWTLEIVVGRDKVVSGLSVLYSVGVLG